MADDGRSGQGQAYTFNPASMDTGAGSAAQMRDELGMTLRSMRDTLATSFNTLNLTMSSIHMTLRNMASAVPHPNVQPNVNYIPAFGSMNLTGGMSGPMASSLANTSMTNLMFGQRPFNVSGMEYGWQRQNELNHRYSQFGVDATTHMTGLGLSSLGGYAATRFAASRGGAVGRMASSGFGKAAIGMGGMLGASMLVDPIMGSISNGANEYGRDISAIRRMSTRFGNEFTNQQSAIAARGIRDYAMRELRGSTDFDTKLGVTGTRNVMMQGMQQNLFQGKSPEELVKQMETAASMVKLLTGVLGSKDVNEAMKQIGQLKGMGINIVNNAQFGVNLAHSTFKYSQQMGVPGAQLLQQAAAYGQQAYGAYGMPSFGGILPAMQNMAYSHELEKRRMISTAELAAAGGHSAMAGKSVQLGAAMMNNGNLGKMFLASGWQGGGNFSAEQMNASLNSPGGYFGMMGAAMGKIAGDPKAYASFMMNQENLYASASSQGGLDGNVKKALFAALDKMPGMDDENSSAMMIKQIGQSMGVDVPTAVAKQWAMERSRPNTFKAFEAEANRHADRGLYFDAKQRYHRFRPFGAAGENIAKIPTLLDDKLTRVGYGLKDAWNSILGEPDEGPGVPNIGASEFNSNTIASLHSSLNRRNSSGINTMSTDEDMFKRAYGLANDEEGMGSISAAHYNPFRPRGDYGMATTVSIASKRKFKDYYDTILNPQGMTASQGVARMGDYYKGGNVHAMMEKYKKSDFYGKNGGAFSFLAEQMGDSINDATSATRNSKWFQGMSDSDADAMARAAGIDTSKYGSGDINELFERIAQSQDKGITGYAASKGISQEQLAYGLSSKLLGSDAGMSATNKLFGANKDLVKKTMAAAGGIARGTGDTIHAERRAMESMSGLSVDKSQIVESLKAVGLSLDDINGVIDGSKDGEGDLQRYGGLVDKLRQGSTLTEADFNSIGSESLRQKLSSMSENMTPDEINKKILGDKFLGGKGSFDDKVAQLMKGSVETGGIDRVMGGMHNIWGLNMTEDQVSSAIQGGNFADLLQSTSGGTKEFQDLKNQMRDVDMGDVQSLRDQYSSVLNGKNVSDSDVKKTIKEAIAGTSLDVAKQQADTTPKPRSIESAIEDFGGQGVVRVKMVDDSHMKAMSKTATSDGGKTGVKTPASIPVDRTGTGKSSTSSNATASGNNQGWFDSVKSDVQGFLSSNWFSV